MTRQAGPPCLLSARLGPRKDKEGADNGNTC